MIKKNINILIFIIKIFFAKKKSFIYYINIIWSKSMPKSKRKMSCLSISILYNKEKWTIRKKKTYFSHLSVFMSYFNEQSLGQAIKHSKFGFCIEV